MKSFPCLTLHNSTLQYSTEPYRININIYEMICDTNTLPYTTLPYSAIPVPRITTPNLRTYLININIYDMKYEYLIMKSFRLPYRDLPYITSYRLAMPNITSPNRININI